MATLSKIATKLAALQTKSEKLTADIKDLNKLVEAEAKAAEKAAAATAKAKASAKKAPAKKAVAKKPAAKKAVAKVAAPSATPAKN
jgi:hypothetical protein